MRDDTRLEQLEMQVDNLRREITTIARLTRGGNSGANIIGVELKEDIGDTTSGLADCMILDWDGTDDTDASGDIDVYDWLDNLGLMAGGKARAVFTKHRNRWEFLSSPGVVVYVGKTDAAHGKGDVGTINIWEGDIGSLPLTETSTPDTLSALNVFADLEADKYAIAIDGLVGVTGALLVSGEC